MTFRPLFTKRKPELVSEEIKASILFHDFNAPRPCKELIVLRHYTQGGLHEICE
jgi:hypothetical protein